ncbi:hypothetical protein BaRGS_00028087 [Batillaria attramentaria]|uniref:small monomeric GTPase n=1 Tax=Batillaria attramentaria TaxID=370345 RepID=A0ABD0K117_9CAEN
MKTTASCLKVVVFGGPQVGKSAVTVRFLTKRFIGEYSSGTDCSYQMMFRYEDAALKVEIVDCSSSSDLEKNKEVDTADAVIVVYSVIDSESLKSAHTILDFLNKRVHFSVPVLLLGNKTDLEHLRQVSRDDVMRMTRNYGCRHCEVSAAESYTGVNRPFQQLLADGLETRRTRLGHVKRRKSLFENVSRRLGNVFRRKSLEEVLPKRRLPTVVENMNRRSV